VRRLRKLVGLAIGSVLLYLAIFACLATKPVSIGYYHRMFLLKARYAQSIRGQKVMVAAGSNGFSSVRCETISSIAGLPCVNLSTTVALGRTMIFGQVKELAHRGDFVLLPFEYRLYLPATDPDWEQIEAPYAMSEDRRLIVELPAQRALSYAFSFDFHYLLASIVENVQWWTYAPGGKASPYLTTAGDRRGHTRAQAHSYAGAMRNQPSYAGQIALIHLDSRELDEFRAFFRWAHDAGVRVVGTLPASIDDVAISDEDAQEVKSLFVSSGAQFILLHNKSQYPSDCFFDSVEHLVEECQIQHSTSLGRELERIINHPDETPAAER
jgi:hypothetical protein